MRKQYSSIALTLLFFMSLPNRIQPQTSKAGMQKPAPERRCVIQEPIHEDIAAQLAKFKRVEMPFHTAGLTAEERKLVGKLVARELLEIEATGDRKRAEDWFKKYDSMPSELKSALRNIHDVPVDIDPVSAFREKIQ